MEKSLLKGTAPWMSANSLFSNETAWREAINSRDFPPPKSTFFQDSLPSIHPPRRYRSCWKEVSLLERKRVTGLFSCQAHEVGEGHQVLKHSLTPPELCWGRGCAPRRVPSARLRSLSKPCSHSPFLFQEKAATLGATPNRAETVLKRT